jgi:hypothetical protein
MKFIVKKYFSGFCSYGVDAPDKEAAYEKAKSLPLKEDEILNSLEEWKECGEVIPEKYG